MGSPFDSEQYSEFQLNIFSNNRDMLKFSHDADDDDDAVADEARAIPRRFLRKQPIKS